MICMPGVVKIYTKNWSESREKDTNQEFLPKDMSYFDIRYSEKSV
jgi:hypothetical protein